MKHDAKFPNVKPQHLFQYINASTSTLLTPSYRFLSLGNLIPTTSVNITVETTTANRNVTRNDAAYALITWSRCTGLSLEIASTDFLTISMTSTLFGPSTY